MANSSPNTENLKPPFTSETAKEAAKKSVEARKRKAEELKIKQAARKSIQQGTKEILETPVTDKKQLETIKKAGLPVKKPTYQDYLIASIILRTIQYGKVDDLTKIAELIGDVSTDITANINLKNDYADAVVEAYKKRKEADKSGG